MSKSLALVPVGVDLTLYLRPKPSEREAMQIANAYDDGAYNAVRRVLGTLPEEYLHALATEAAPSYIEIRNFLVGDCDVDQRIAERIAFYVVSRRNRFAANLYPRRKFARGDRGWI